jgi:cobalt transporter subunit CbtB
MVSNREKTARARSVDLSGASSALWLAVTAFLALLALYVVGLEHGAVSLVGGDSTVHEFLHDARHLLGFPCH